MQKIKILIVCLFTTIIFTDKSYATTECSSRQGATITSGPSTVSPGCVETYSFALSGCYQLLHDIYLTDEEYATIVGIDLGSTYANVDVEFSNTSATQSRSTKLVLVHSSTALKTCSDGRPPECVSGTDMFMEPERNITIVGLPSKPTFSLVKNKGRVNLTPSANNNNSFNWSINGQTINTSGYYTYTPTTCGESLSGWVRSKNECGLISGKTYFSHTFPSSVPTKPTITGPGTLNQGSSGFFYSPTNHTPLEYDWAVTGSSGTYRINQEVYDFFELQNIIDHTTNYTIAIKVRARNTCGWSAWSNNYYVNLNGGPKGGDFPVPDEIDNSTLTVSKDAPGLIPNVRFNDLWTLQEEYIANGYHRIEIYNLSGTLLLNRSIRDATMNDITTLVRGTQQNFFIAKIIGDDKVVTTKFSIVE